MKWYLYGFEYNIDMRKPSVSMKTFYSFNRMKKWNDEIYSEIEHVKKSKFSKVSRICYLSDHPLPFDDISAEYDIFKKKHSRRSLQFPIESYEEFLSRYLFKNACRYNGFEFTIHNKYSFICKNNKFGIIDSDLNLVVPFDYDAFKALYQDSHLIVLYRKSDLTFWNFNEDGVLEDIPIDNGTSIKLVDYVFANPVA